MEASLCMQSIHLFDDVFFLSPIGQDMQPGKEGGTWLAMNKHGRISVLLNVGQSDSETITVTDPTSGRVFYAIEWVTNMDQNMKGIFNIVKEKHGNRQQTFRLVVFDTK